MINRTATLLIVSALVLVMAGCVSGRRRYARATGNSNAWSTSDALSAVKIETTVDRAGRMEETEYHIRPDEVPANVRAAMDARHPGGTYIGAEKEYNNGQLYYELSKDIDGYEVEAMFHPDGRPHDSEIQIPVDQVPQAVQDAIAKGYPNGSVKHWEAIRKASDDIVEYHVKLEDAGKALKVIVSPGGSLKAAFREIPAEIEVPVSLP